MKLKQIAAILTAALILAQSTMVFAEDVSSLSTGSEVSTQATSSVESNVSESISESVISAESSSPSAEETLNSEEQAASSEEQSSSSIASSSTDSSSSEASSSEETSSSSSASSISSSSSSSSEAASSSDLTEEVDINVQAADGVKQYVTRLYKTTLNRDPDESGLNNWVSWMESGEKSAAEVMQGIFESNEYVNRNKSDDAYITDLYHAVFGTEPDAAGFKNWQNHLYNGMSRRYILYGFAGSDGFKQLCAGYSVNAGSIKLEQNRDKNANVTAFVTRLYRIVLDSKTPDVNGINDWTGRLLSGSHTGADVVVGFFDSDNYKAKSKSENDYITDLYHALFNSEADAPGRNNWLNHMANGMSRTYILSGFVGSDGFRNLCGQYGIKLGTVNLTQNRDQNTVATAFVHRLYIHALGRTTVSEADLNSRVGDLRSNKITAANMLKEIFSSDEYKGRNLDNAEFVHASYKTLYGRDARDAELGQKLSYLNAHSTQDLLAVLIDSSEFKTICAAAGITSGSLTQSKAVYNILDVSAYQNTINWSAVAASGKVDGVMIRAVSTSNTSNGPYVDPYFAANVIGAKRAGLKVGVYYVLYGQNIGECASEVNLMLSEIAKLEAQGYYIDLPVACDLEYNTGKLSAGYLTTLGRYSMDLIELAGYYPLLYTGANFSQNSLNLSEIGNRDLWIAWYPYLLHNSIVYGIKGTPYENVLAPIEATPCTKSGNPTNPATVGVNSYSIWQYRSDANISGINGKVDINYAYKDYATILATTTRSDGTKWNHLK